MTGHASLLFVLAAVLKLQLHGADALQCYNCYNIRDITACNVTMTCGVNQACYRRTRSSSGTMNDLGCMDLTQCADAAVSMVGRSLDRERQTRSSDCSECCSSEKCNKQLCVHRTPLDCIDDTTVDCARLSSLFSICTGNYEHAAMVCSRTCNLCNYTNGHWAEWLSWTACSITCSSMTQMRSRTCSNPPPSTHGKNCVGTSMEHKSCVRSPCPVAVGWGTWNTWDSCSATCDAGIQQRNRFCDNPPPTTFADHCIGHYTDFRLCVQRSCTAGGWSSWTSWSTCTVTCGGGSRQRYRECSNPTPSPYGQQCQGPNVDFNMCNTHPCALLVRQTSGRLDINIYGIWGTICDDGVDFRAAKVACRMLGLSTYNAQVYVPTEKGLETMLIFLDDLNCTGNETSVLECCHAFIGHHNCGHSEDMGVTC